MSDMDKLKISEIQRTNKPLYRAYLLKESLAKALDYPQPKRARDALEGWLSWAMPIAIKAICQTRPHDTQTQTGHLGVYKRSRHQWSGGRYQQPLTHGRA